MCAKLWKTCISSKIPFSFRECQSKKRLSDYIHEVFYPKVTFFKDLCGAFKICLVAFLNSFPVLIFCSFPMHLLCSKICFLVLFMMNHYLQDFLSMNSSMLTNTFSKLAHSIACIISNKRLAYFLASFFSGFTVHFWIKRKPSNAYSLYCSCGVSNSAMSWKLVLLLGRDYYCKFKEVKANERFKRLKRNTFLYNGFFGGSLSSLLHSSNWCHKQERGKHKYVVVRWKGG